MPEFAISQAETTWLIFIGCVGVILSWWAMRKKR
jgi:hypothetical protein